MTYGRRKYLSLLGTAAAAGSAGCAGITLPWEEQSQEFPLNPTQEAKIAPDDGDASDGFGWSVALSRDGATALIGARRADSPAAERSGAAYVFDSSDGSWSQQTKLAWDSADRGDLIGSSVALSSDGKTALVGGGDVDSDHVRVFDGDRDSWTEQDELYPDGGSDSALFGSPAVLSSDGTTACIGAQGSFRDPTSSAYVFHRGGDEWTQRASFPAGDSAVADNFGQSVAVSGDGTRVLVSNLGSVGTDEAAGSAYLFDRSDGSWTQQTKLTADGAQEDLFGSPVALSKDGTTALVGAREDNGPTRAGAGSAYVFDGSGGSWSQQTRLTPSGGDRDDNFGKSMALSSDGTIALISATLGEGQDGAAVGSAHVLDGSGGEWNQTGRFTADDGDSGDGFGWEVALSGDGTTALISALEDEDPNGWNAGSAYVFAF